MSFNYTGLSLVFYTENVLDGDQYESDAFKYNKYSAVQNNQGVRLEIHGKNELPAPQDAGIFIYFFFSNVFSLFRCRDTVCIWANSLYLSFILLIYISLTFSSAQSTFISVYN